MFNRTFFISTHFTFGKPQPDALKRRSNKNFTGHTP
jgi:hypothetical protein